jgi:hypothetical protein
MGERLVLVRLPDVDARRQARKALKHSRSSRAMIGELSAAVGALFDADPVRPPERSEAEEEQLIDLAALVVRCRSAVERDGYSREIELIPAPEAPARLAIVLDHLLAGLLTLRADRQTAWNVVTAAALDSIPALRRSVMDTLMCARQLPSANAEMTKAQVATGIGYPPRTAERTLDDLVAHGVLEVHRRGQGAPTTWEISPWVAESYIAAATFPEKSKVHTYTQHIHETSGKVGLPPAPVGSATALEPDPLSAAVSVRGTPALGDNGYRDWTDDELQALVDAHEEPADGGGRP